MSITYLKFILLFLAGLVFQWLLIKLFHKLRIFQTIRDDGPKSHLQKRPTPTLGGVGMAATLILAAVIFKGIIEGNGFNFWFLTASALVFGLIGLVDDLFLIFKVGRREATNWRGLVGRYKLLLQAAAGVFFGLILLGRGYNLSLDGAAASLGFSHPWGYLLLAAVLMVATVNAVNLTDGLDGLAGGVTLPVLGAFLFFAAQFGNSGALIFSLIMILAVLSFLIFNSHPARIFMGDTGSHLLGGAIAGLALILHKEFLLILLGGVFVAEALSVILQVASFKLTKKRIFKMSPLHHHFELSGWSEKKVVYVFWGASVLFAFIVILSSISCL